MLWTRKFDLCVVTMANYIILEVTPETVESFPLNDTQNRADTHTVSETYNQQESSVRKKLLNFSRFDIIDTCLKVRMLLPLNDTK